MKFICNLIKLILLSKLGLERLVALITWKRFYFGSSFIEIRFSGIFDLQLSCNAQITCNVFLNNFKDTMKAFVDFIFWPPPPLWRFNFFKTDENGAWKFLLEKGRGKAKWPGLSRNGEVAILYWGFSGGYSWCSIEKISRCVYLSFVNKHVLQNNCLNEIWDDWHSNSLNSVDSYNSCINYSCK